MEESKESGGKDFYQKVYEADRPELFSRHCHTVYQHMANRCASVKIPVGMFRNLNLH